MKPTKPKNKKKDIRELPSDLSQAWDQTRLLNKKALQDVYVPPVQTMSGVCHVSILDPYASATFTTTGRYKG